MKATLWMRLKGTPESKIIWEGELPVAPSEGQVVFVSRDWAGVTLDKVFYLLYDGSVQMHCTEYHRYDYEKWDEFIEQQPQNKEG